MYRVGLELWSHVHAQIEYCAEAPTGLYKIRVQETDPLVRWVQLGNHEKPEKDEGEIRGRSKQAAAYHLSAKCFILKLI